MQPWSWRTRSLFLLLVTVWGLNFIFIKIGLAYADPLWLALLSALVGAAGTAVLLTGIGSWRTLNPRGRRDALLLGVPNIGAFYAFLFSATQLVLPGLAAIVLYTFPLWVALLSPWVLGHRLTLRHWGAVTMGFVGIFLISEAGSTVGAGVPLVPVLELTGAAVSWAVGTVLFQRRFASAELPEANAFQLVGGAVTLGAVVVLLTPAGFPGFAPGLWLAVGWIGILGTTFAYAVWFHLLGRTRASSLSAYVFLVPVVALLGSAVIFGERLSPIQLGGVALVLLSIYLIARATETS